MKNFSLLVTNKDLEAIDDKSSIYKEQETPGTESAFGGFEMDIDENDWLSTKAKLENEKAVLAQDNFMSRGFNDFALDLKPDDWTKTYQKLQDAKKRRVAYWWLSAGMIALVLGLFLISRQYTGDALPTPAITENKQALDVPSALAETPVVKETPAALDTDKSVDTENGNVRSGNTADASGTEMKKQDLVKSGNTSNNTATNKETVTGNKTAQVSKEHVMNVNTYLVNKTVAELKEKEEVKFAVEKNADITENPLTDGSEKVSEVPVETSEKVANVEETIKEPVVNVEPTDSNKNKKQDKPNLPINKLPKTRLYVGLVNQLGSTFRQLDRQNNARYNEIRNASEKPFTQWTYGLEFGVQKSKSQFSVGVQSTTQTWISSYNYYNSYYKDSIRYYVLPDTNLLHTFYFNRRDTSVNENHVVKINKVQVPFEFTQFFTLSTKMKFMTTIGGTIGFITRSEGGKILVPSNTSNIYLKDYSSLGNIERKVSLAPSLSFGIQYQVTKHFMLQGSAFGNYSMSNRYNNDFPVKEYIYTIGGSIKLLYLIK